MYHCFEVANCLLRRGDRCCVDLMIFARGVVHNAKRARPRTDPWGTPQESLTGSDLVLSTKSKTDYVGQIGCEPRQGSVLDTKSLLEAGENNRVVDGVESSRTVEECKERDLFNTAALFPTC